MNKTRFKFPVGEKHRLFPSDPKAFSIKPITMAEERDASKISKEPADILWESVKRSLVSADDKPLSMMDGTTDSFIESVSPKVRKLILAAYIHVHHPGDGDEESFLGKMEASL